MRFIEWRSEVLGVRGRVVVSVLEFVVLLASGLRNQGLLYIDGPYFPKMRFGIYDLFPLSAKTRAKNLEME
jgi:hypothetical protein